MDEVNVSKGGTLSDPGLAVHGYDVVAFFTQGQPVLGSDATQQTVRFGVFTVAACQIVSNVPFVLLAAQWVRKLADPHLGWLSLALVSTLAGNLTPVASVANLIVLELAGDKGKIPFLRFLWLGALCTFIPLAVGVACLLVERGYF